MTGIDFAVPDGWAVSFATVAAGLAGRPGVTAEAVDYHDTSSPFRVEATLGAWHVTTDADGRRPRLSLSIACGTLHDEDKGAVDLAGVEIGLGGSDAQPCDVLNPGRLSELQQAGLVDAIASHLEVLGSHYAAATLETLDGSVTVTGILATSHESGTVRAAFWAARAASEASGAATALSALANTHSVARLTTIAGGHPLAFRVSAVSIDEAVCLVGWLE